MAKDRKKERKTQRRNLLKQIAMESCGRRNRSNELSIQPLSPNSNLDERNDLTMVWLRINQLVIDINEGNISDGKG